MFDIGWAEITIIVIVAIIVIGPKDLPRVLRTVGQWVGKAKALTREFRGHIDDMIQETELAEVKKQIDSVGSMDVEKIVENTIDPNGDIKDAMDFSGDEFANALDFKDQEKRTASEVDSDEFDEEDEMDYEPEEIAEAEDFGGDTGEDASRETSGEAGENGGSVRNKGEGS